VGRLLERYARLKDVSIKTMAATVVRGVQMVMAGF
jgi:hypothetical protein